MTSLHFGMELITGAPVEDRSDSVSLHPAQVDLSDQTTSNASFDDVLVFQLDQSFKSDLEYQVSGWLLFIYRPASALIGMAGNLMSILVVMTTPQLRQNATSVYMVALAVLDWLISMYSALTLLPKESFIGEEKFFSSTWQCRLHYFAILFVIHFDTLTMVSMTAQRFIAVRHPLKAAVWNTKKGAVISLLLCAAVAFLANVVHLLTFQVQPFDGRYRGRCSTGEGLGQFMQMRVYPWVDSAIYFFIPSISISIFNIFIYRALQEASLFKRRAVSGHDGLSKHHGSAGGPSSSAESTKMSSTARVGHLHLEFSFSQDLDAASEPAVSTNSRKTLAGRPLSGAVPDSHRGARQLSKMLLCVSIAFLVFTSPLGVFVVVFRYWNPTSGHEKAVFTLIYDVTECLMFTNHSINFLLYCVSGSKFRSKAVSILYCGGRQKKMKTGKW